MVRSELYDFDSCQCYLTIYKADQASYITQALHYTSDYRYLTRTLKLFIFFVPASTALRICFSETVA